MAREAENQRLRGVESAAFAALAELDHLLRRADAAAVTDNNRTTTLRAAERG